MGHFGGGAAHQRCPVNLEADSRPTRRSRPGNWRRRIRRVHSGWRTRRVSMLCGLRLATAERIPSSIDSACKDRRTEGSAVGVSPLRSALAGDDGAIGSWVGSRTWVAVRERVGVMEETATDAVLVAASCRDPARFGVIFERHAEEIRRFLVRRVGTTRRAQCWVRSFGSLSNVAGRIDRIGPALGRGCMG